MNKPAWSYIRDMYAPPSGLSTSEWGEANINYALAPEYDTPAKAPFNSMFAPYMRVVLDWLDDYETREIWLCKSSRACATEYVMVYVRRCVAEHSRRICYMSADMAMTERFMEDRIKVGFKACPAAQKQYRRARVVEHDIRFPSMVMRVNWPSAAGAFRQDGWEVFIMDEYSKFKASVASEARKRCASYTMHKIVGLSSPDEKRKGGGEDPIFQEYDATNQCLWMMPDPVTGNPFTWGFGGEGKTYGIKWPESAQNPESLEWDMERVRAEAYYLTPDGTKIYEADRLSVSAQGEAVPQNPSAPAHKKGLKIVGPMTPFSAGSFGYLATEFLEAKTKGGESLRRYFCENWADVGDTPNSDSAASVSLRSRELNYQRGKEFFDAKDSGVDPDAIKGLFLTVDVQKYSLWWVARWWSMSGERCDTGLSDWGNVPTMDDIYALIEKLEPAGVGIDIHYAERRGEVADFCADTGAIGLMGSDDLKTDLNLRDDLDPSEGRKSRHRDGSKYNMLTWNVDIFRGKLLAAIRGETPWRWVVPSRISMDSQKRSGIVSGREYTRQVMSTHKVDGVWTRRKGFPNDHLFDCEAMQLALARYDNFIQ